MTDKYKDLRAALDAFKPGNGDAMLAYRLASDPKIVRALLAERDALREALTLALEYWADRQQRYKNRSPVWVQTARAALAQEGS